MIFGGGWSMASFMYRVVVLREEGFCCARKCNSSECCWIEAAMRFAWVVSRRMRTLDRVLYVL
jgi:hypothetical protein